MWRRFDRLERALTGGDPLAYVVCACMTHPDRVLDLAPLNLGEAARYRAIEHCDGACEPMEVVEARLPPPPPGRRWVLVVVEYVRRPLPMGEP
jgi:hypothetical protein